METSHIVWEYSAEEENVAVRKNVTLCILCLRLDTELHGKVCAQCKHSSPSHGTYKALPQRIPRWANILLSIIYPPAVKLQVNWSKSSYTGSVCNEGVQQWIWNRTCLSLPVLCVTCSGVPSPSLHISFWQFSVSHPECLTWKCRHVSDETEG